MVWLARLVGRLPLAWALLLARVIGWLWFWCVPIRRGVARRNIRLALGEQLSARQQRRVLRACFTHMALWGVEVLRAAEITPATSRQRVTPRGFEAVDAARAAGRGAILFVSHLDNIDLAGISQAVCGLPVVVVVKEVAMAALNDYLSAVRRSKGVELLAAKGSYGQLRAALAANKVVCLVVDQHVPRSQGIVCEMFGRLVSTTSAPVRLAMASGAPLLPVVMRRRGLSGEHELVVEPELRLEYPYADEAQNIWHNSQRMTHIVEGWIRAHPEQWLWHHRRWKVADDPIGWVIPAPLAALTAGGETSRSRRPR